MPIKPWTVRISSCIWMAIVSLTYVFSANGQQIITGAEQTPRYLAEIGKSRVAVVANPGSRVSGIHLVDTLINLGVNVSAVFAPEHGFRGEAEAGEVVIGGMDAKTGVKVISLYGEHKKPTDSDLEKVDMVLFDIQDVGVRFYTYISTLQYVMESCARKGIPLVILDRPNPHGHLVDGPVLEVEHRSFVGMQPIPVLHGMTVAEYASMLNGEKWLEDGLQCKLIVVCMLNWKHSSDYHIIIPPSPNLPNDAAIRLYPSLCFFEGTAVSLGRGTDYPFQCYGYPGYPDGDFAFVPRSIPGKSKTPLYEGRECQGRKLTHEVESGRLNKIRLDWLLDAWHHFPDSTKFFIPFFTKLAGTTRLQEQIEAGWSEEQIRADWHPALENFRKVREKYLLYPD